MHIYPKLLHTYKRSLVLNIVLKAYSDQCDSLSEAGQIGGSADNSAGGRQSRAAFFETLVPVMDDLELSIAGRYDDYSDFGGQFSPKVWVQ
jgi:iron complex outermembrane receptor protein